MVDLEKIIYIPEDRLSQVKTLIYGTVGLLLFITMIDSLVAKLEIFLSYRVRPITYTLIILIWRLYWLYNKYILPRNNKNTIGIVIAIHSENDKERKQLKSDFVLKLKKILQDENILKSSKVIFLKNHFSSQINDSDNPKATLEKMNKTIKAHFYVWGSVKIRPDGEKGEKCFISFQGYVVHKPIPQNISDTISKDFSNILPKEINFLENRSFKGFETSAKIVNIATKYIIGIAAFVSYDPLLAFNLHNGLKQELDKLYSEESTTKNLVNGLTQKNFKDIRNRIPKFISDETLWIAKWHYKNKNTNETKKYLNISLNENSKNYGSWLFQAIIDFSIDSNPEKALKSINNAKKCVGPNSYERMYSEAFLYFWKENYPKAINICQKIRKQQYKNESNTVQEVRQFNKDILDNYNNKVQLYFWNGYISYFKANHLGDALENFENFEKLADNSMSILKNKSSVYIKEIKNTIGINT